MKLLGKRVILKEIEQKEKKSLIIVVNKPESHSIIGEVVAVGNEVTLVKPKDTVLVNRQTTGLVEWKGEMIFLVNEEEVIAFEKHA